MRVYKAYKFRMYPTSEQKTKLNSHLGTSRFIYHPFLYEKDKRYQEKAERYEKR